MPNGIHGARVERKRLASLCLLMAWFAAVPLFDAAQAAGTTSPTQPVAQQISLAQAQLQSVRNELFVNQKAQKVPGTRADKVDRLKEREVVLKKAERGLIARIQRLRDQQHAQEREEARARQEAQARRDQGRAQTQQLKGRFQ